MDLNLNLIQQDLILILIITTKILFPTKVIFQSFRWTYFFWGQRHYSTKTEARGLFFFLTFLTFVSSYLQVVWTFMTMSSSSIHPPCQCEHVDQCHMWDQGCTGHRAMRENTSILWKLGAVSSHACCAERTPPFRGRWVGHEVRTLNSFCSFQPGI